MGTLYSKNSNTGKSVLRCLYIAAKNLCLYGEYEWGICKSANDCCAPF